MTICGTKSFKKILKKLIDCDFSEKHIKLIISFDEIVLENICDEKKPMVLLWSQLINMGKAMPFSFTEPSPSDIATLCYTSGSSAVPKACILTHSNLVASASGSLNSGIELFSSDVYFSYLPLSHVYERLMVEVVFTSGASIGFYSGDISNLLDDMIHLKPTIFASVPRIFNKLCETILQSVQASGSFYQNLFDTALLSKQKNLNDYATTKSFFWDKLVFSKVKARFGGRIRLVLSGSAPIENEIYDFLKVTLSCPVIQGYGLTETSAASNIQRFGDQISGTVGATTSCCEMKLVSCPEMNYLVSSDPPCGEICIRGFNVFLGYFKQDSATQQVLDSQKWFHTGDIGCIDEHGNLKIIDRINNIFKLPDGHHVSIEKIEKILLNNTFTSQIFVYGDSLHSHLVAIVVPNFDAIKTWNQKHQIFQNLTDNFESDQIKSFIFTHLFHTGLAKGLQQFELVNNIHIEISNFSTQNELLSSTLKLNRPKLMQKYSETILKLFESKNLIPDSNFVDLTNYQILSNQKQNIDLSQNNVKKSLNDENFFNKFHY